MADAVPTMCAIGGSVMTARSDSCVAPGEPGSRAASGADTEVALVEEAAAAAAVDADVTGLRRRVVDATDDVAAALTLLPRRRSRRGGVRLWAVSSLGSI